ncbi:MAG: hypothetical protein JW913_13605 [Chitinispirillaceae bacterium]|nr:hypothetical protein [Chitinispirillaceae bacterium]
MKFPVSPYGDVRILPEFPTATSCPVPAAPEDDPVQMTASSLLLVPEVLLVHAIPTGNLLKVALTVRSEFIVAKIDVSFESELEKSPPHAAKR